MIEGLVAGRFLPPHNGHLMLAETAAALCDRLTILLCWRDDDPIAPALRAAWLGELLPAARILAHRGRPGLDAAAMAAIGRVDRLFSGDPADAALAEAVVADFVPVDPDHLAVPIASAAVRAEPLRHWWDMPAPVRAHHARTICLHGPESTGKSTLAPLIARHFATGFVPEYGRTYCEQHGLALAMDDLVAIARTHAAMTRAARRRCNRRLILDTDPLMTAVWADMLFGRRDRWFDGFAETADFYLLLDIDLPWVDDGTRFFGDDARRRRFLDLSRAELERRGLPYAIVGGPREVRLGRVLEAIAAAGIA